MNDSAPKRRNKLSCAVVALPNVPQATLARIESGRARDPRFRTVERLVRAAGGGLAIGVAGDGLSGVVAEVPVVPHDGLRDEAGRRYPAHLDVWEVREPRDWPGAWWANWYNLPPALWPIPVPAATFELNRGYRDRRRWAQEVRRAVRVRRVTGGGLPGTSWRLVAELPDGELIGELRAHERSPHLTYGDDPSDEREIVLDGILVAGGYRRLGVGRRLVERLAEEMDRREIRTAHAIADAAGTDLLLACGYRLEASRPWALRLDRPEPAAR